MIALSLGLPAGPSRILNVVLGTVYAAIMLLIVSGGTWAYYMLFATNAVIEHVVRESLRPLKDAIGKVLGTIRDAANSAGRAAARSGRWSALVRYLATVARSCRSQLESMNAAGSGKSGRSKSIQYPITRTRDAGEGSLFTADRDDALNAK